MNIHLILPTFLAALVLLSTPMSNAATKQPVTTEQRAAVEKYYKDYCEAFNRKDLEAVMAAFDDEFRYVFAGPDKAQSRDAIKQLFDSNKSIRIQSQIHDIFRVDRYLVALTQCTIEGQPSGPASKNPSLVEDVMEFLVENQGRLQSRYAISLDRKALKFVKGQTYQNDIIGFSVSAPNGWMIVPYKFPLMLESVVFFKPGSDSVGMLGYLEVPINASLESIIKADIAATRNLAKESYQDIANGQRMISGVEAFDNISQFTLPGDRERKRQRIYFNAGGLLYTFIMDAMPPSEWDAVSPSFQVLIDSFKLTEAGKSDALKRARAEKASGEIAEGIYSNTKAGCQIAAPEGWTLEASNISQNFLFSVNIKPPSGDSVVRFIAAETGGVVSQDEVIKSQLDATQKLTKNFSTESEKEFTVGNHTGKIFVQTFTIEQIGSFKRKMVMVVANNILYMVVCDAIPPTEYPKIESQFDEIIKSFILN